MSDVAEDDAGFRNFSLVKSRQGAGGHQSFTRLDELLHERDLRCGADVLDQQSAFNEECGNAGVRGRPAGLERDCTEELRREAAELRMP